MPQGDPVDREAEGRVVDPEGDPIAGAREDAAELEGRRRGADLRGPSVPPADVLPASLDLSLDGARVDDRGVG